jgi:hypothetical protein
VAPNILASSLRPVRCDPSLEGGIQNVVAQLKLKWLTPVGEADAEQRGSPRRKVSMAAVVAVGDGAVDCTIRDISASGVQLLAPSVLRLPDEVRLLILSEGLLIHAQRIWARFPLSGLRFISVEDIRRSAHPQAAPLREAWKNWRAQQNGE